MLVSVLLLQTCQVEASVVKPCSKTQLNKIVKDLKCQKVGGLYRWVKLNQQPVLKPTTPTPTPTASPVKPTPVDSPAPQPTPTEKAFAPWSTDFSLDQMVLQSNSSWDKWEKELSNTTNPHYLFVDQEVSPKITEIIKDFDLKAGNLVSALIKKPTYTLVGKSCDWVNRKIRELGSDKIPDRITPCEESKQYITYMHNNNNFVAMIIPANDSAIYYLQTPGAGSDIAHEYFHGVQVNLVGMVGDHYNNTNLPQWFLEGSATYFAYSVWCRANNKDCLANNSYMLSGPQSQPTGYTHGLASYTSTRVLRGNPEYKYSYDIGYRAIQYITASSGMNNIINILTNFKSTGNFERSFENVTNKSLANFYKIFDESRPSIKFPPLTTNK